jgi:photosystem II stability/assembly factor-like uncharacterized protein
MQRWENILLYGLLVLTSGCDLISCPDEPAGPSTKYVKIWQTDINDQTLWKGYKLSPVVGKFTSLTSIGGSSWLVIGREQDDQDSTKVFNIVELTTDGGDNWSKVVDFADHLPNDPATINDIAGDGTPNRAVIVGSGGTILRTTDAGSNWALITSGTSKELNSIDIQTGSFGVIAGDGVILRSLNGGVSWSQATLPGGLNGTFQRVAIRPPVTAFAIGTEGAQTRVLRTTDRGGTWQLLQAPDLGGAADLAIAGDTLVVINGVKNVRSTDNGDHWQTMTDLPGLGGVRRIAYFEGNWVTGAAGDFFRSTDGAATWTMQSDSSTFIHDSNNNRVTVNDLVLYQGLGSGGFQGFAVGY